MGVIMLKNGQADEAKVWIDRSLRTNPEYVPSLINRAHLAMRRREYVTAENDLQKAGQLDPSSLDAQLALGILYRKTGRMSAAKLAFEKAIAIDPQSAFARYHLGSLLASEFRDTTNALQLFYDVLQAKDQDIELVNLAKARIQSIRDSRLYEKRSDKESYQ
jgi:Tfp pilus assembly protein PilF